MFTKVLATPQGLGTTQSMKISIKGFFSKCDQIRRKLQSGHISEKPLTENLIFVQ